jgi:hypothetical protein
MPRQRQKSARAQAGIHFIIADPSSSRERPDNLRIVRSHVGRWRWQQAKKKSQRESPPSSDTDHFPAGESSHDYRSSDSETNERLAGDILGDTQTDTESYPFLVPESAVPGQTYFGQDLLDEDAFTFSNPESEMGLPDHWDEPNAATDFDYGSSMCLSGVSPSILDPFQTIGASPLSLDLVSRCNKYCRFLNQS